VIKPDAEQEILASIKKALAESTKHLTSAQLTGTLSVMVTFSLDHGGVRRIKMQWEQTLK
jgi:hypothetical protein